MTADSESHAFTMNGATDIRGAEAELAFARERIEMLTAQLTTAQQEQALPLARRISRISQQALPSGTVRRRAIGTTWRTLAALRSGDPAKVLRDWRDGRAGIPALGPVDVRWSRYCARHDPSPSRLRRMRELSATWPEPPLVSVLMPTYNPNPDLLREAIESVRSQAYEHWELCIVDDGSSTTVAAECASAYVDDQRLRFSVRATNGGIAAASQTAATLASGDLIAFLDHDDVMRPHALFEMVRHFLANPRCDFAYSDEDKLDQGGRRLAPFLKPDWSPELMESCNYFGHLTMIRRDLFDRVQGFRDGFDGSQDYDLFLRCCEQAQQIGHVREALYSWRINEGSAAGGAAAKPHAYLAAVRCLESRLERCGIDGTVTEGAWKGLYHVRRRIAGTPSVAVIIPALEAADVVSRSVECVEREGAGRDVRIVVVDGSGAGAAAFERLDVRGLTVVVHNDAAFSVSRMVNLGVSSAGAVDHVLIVTPRLVLGRPGWLDALLEHSQMADVGAVGGRLFDYGGGPSRDGIRVGGTGAPAEELDLSEYFGMALATRTVSAVSGDCLLLKAKLWEDLGGFDESFAIACADIDLSLRLMRAGHRNVYTPLAELVVRTEGMAVRPAQTEDERRFIERWGPFPQGYDRYVGGHIRSFKPIQYR